ncbi:hypothetical protein EDD36DRAFT_423473 [Exophiala viscosa]|uniref:Uncharacterized protein n=1 Tax=Exophiala viscosa TaxID=2486360 RepID=A0AAN6DN39_9EURO|nr:hypothetical protein EDD36DRAFT_423473 [Exophiala viscosa]
MNTSQLTRVKLSRKALGGFTNVHGPLGTGKTYLCGELGRLIIIANLVNAYLLVVLASNKLTDTLIVCFHGIVLYLAIPGQYVTRAHSTSTKANIARKEGNKLRKKLTNTRP